MLPASFTSAYLKKLELLNLKSRKLFLTMRQGIHTSLKRGHGLEFSDYRKYEPGDDPRHIDWGVYARSEKLYVKKFSEEQAITVSIFIDSSASMLAVKEDQKFSFSSDLALSLAYVALMQNDTVHISVPGVIDTPKFSSLSGIHQLGNLILNIKDLSGSETVTPLKRSLARLSFPGIAVFISDFLMPIEDIRSIFQGFLAKNLDTYAIQVLGQHDLNPLDRTSNILALDSETMEELELSLDAENLSEYEKILDLHQKEIKQFLSANGIPFMQTISSQPLEQVITEQLPKLGLLF